MPAPNDDRSIRILHLSDIHFKADKAWDADPVLHALVRFIAKDVNNGLAPDLVAITGDVAFAGVAEEYQLARDWLEKQLWPALPKDFPRDRLLLVPGNHDVDRRQVGAGVRHMQNGLLSGKDQNGIAALLQDDDERKIVLKRHAAYLAFLGDWLGETQSLPWWQRSIEIDGTHLHVAGLDSAWMACGDADRNQLLLGRYQIHQTILHPSADDADWRLALLHHPWDYCAEFDGHEARSTTHQHCDLLLRGHLHQPQSERITPPDPSRACLELAAGCVYENSRYPNAFQWIELYPQPRRVKVLFRVWIQGAWTIDRSQPDCPEGYAEFPLWKCTEEAQQDKTKQQRSIPPRKPFQAPLLPPYYVERLGDLQKVLEQLIAEDNDSVTMLAITALHGWGGIGKTALATAVAHSDKARKHFSDGILWVTLGQDPQLLALLNTWILAFGEQPLASSSIESVSSYLRTILYEQAVLLIIDDVWEEQHVKPFLVGGPKCRVLITTRRVVVSDSIGADTYTLNPMNTQESLQLITQRARGKRTPDLLSAEEKSEAIALVEELGHLPLAITIIGALIARGYTWDEARCSLFSEKNNLDTGYGYQSQGKQIIEASLMLSLRHLRTRDFVAWKAFIWLAVVPNKTIFNASMAATIWDLQQEEAERVLATLADEAILQRVGREWLPIQKNNHLLSLQDMPSRQSLQRIRGMFKEKFKLRRYNMHDFMHDMARKIFIDPDIGFQLTPSQAHTQVMNNYRRLILDNRWDQLPDDKYIHTKLVWHMKAPDYP